VYFFLVIYLLLIKNFIRVNMCWLLVTKKNPTWNNI